MYAVSSRRSNNTIHFYYESALLKALIVLDLPSLVLAAIVSLPMVHERSPLFNPSLAPWISDGLSILFACLQWWLIGFVIQSVLTRKRPERSVLPQ